MYKRGTQAFTRLLSVFSIHYIKPVNILIYTVLRQTRSQTTPMPNCWSRSGMLPPATVIMVCLLIQAPASREEVWKVAAEANIKRRDIDRDEVNQAHTFEPPRPQVCHQISTCQKGRVETMNALVWQSGQPERNPSRARHVVILRFQFLSPRT